MNPGRGSLFSPTGGLGEKDEGLIGRSMEWTGRDTGLFCGEQVSLMSWYVMVIHIIVSQGFIRNRTWQDRKRMLKDAERGPRGKLLACCGVRRLELCPLSLVDHGTVSVVAPLMMFNTCGQPLRLLLRMILQLQETQMLPSIRPTLVENTRTFHHRAKAASQSSTSKQFRNSEGLVSPDESRKQNHFTTIHIT